MATLPNGRIQGNSTSEEMSFGKDIVFTNRTNPVEDPLIRRVEGEIAQIKKKITNTDSNIRASFKVVKKAKEL